MTKPDPDAEWWTTSDVAEYLGVVIGTVSSYRNRGQMPEPTKTIGRTHLWSPSTIIAWNEGRSPRQQAAALASYEFVQVSTAVETRDQAQKLVRAIVENKLAAGAQIVGPVLSAFWHLGEFGTGEEWRILLKTRASTYADLEAYLLAHHPWDSPEVVAIPIVAGSADCLEWLRKSVKED
ncbi:divalent cation tolerance protein CutA [Actinoplanes sp. NPDC049599]|uniref:divalent cation tolerance protein CutA n=1 Tax=Actinoplanes sp. NPDC049599 TaxID=3363903 RepID=UPI0037A6FEAB